MQRKIALAMMLRLLFFCAVKPESGALPNQMAPQGGSPALYVSKDPTVNAVLGVGRKQVAESGWYNNRIVVPTKRNRLERAIVLASGNASRNIQTTQAMQQELAQQVSDFAHEVVQARSFGYVLSEGFKAVMNSFLNRFKKIEEAIKIKIAEQKQSGTR